MGLPSCLLFFVVLCLEMQAYVCHPVSSVHIPLRAVVCPIPHITELFSMGSRWETRKPANWVHLILAGSHINLTPLALKHPSDCISVLSVSVGFFLSRSLLLLLFPAQSSLKTPRIHSALPPWWFPVSALTLSYVSGFPWTIWPVFLEAR